MFVFILFGKLNHDERNIWVVIKKLQQYSHMGVYEYFNSKYSVLKFKYLPLIFKLHYAKTLFHSIQ